MNVELKRKEAWNWNREYFITLAVGTSGILFWLRWPSSPLTFRPRLLSTSPPETRPHRLYLSFPRQKCPPPRSLPPPPPPLFHRVVPLWPSFRAVITGGKGQMWHKALTSCSEGVVMSAAWQNNSMSHSPTEQTLSLHRGPGWQIWWGVVQGSEKVAASKVWIAFCLFGFDRIHASWRLLTLKMTIAKNGQLQSVANKKNVNSFTYIYSLFWVCEGGVGGVGERIGPCPNTSNFFLV